MNKTNRIFSIDLIKVIAIYLVICLHTSPIPLTLPSPISQLTIILYSFAKTGVPLFIMASGYLLLTKKEKIKRFVKKRSNKILLPWIFWTFVCAIFAIQSNITPIKGLFQNFIHIFLYSYWFMPVITMMYLLTPLLKKQLSAISTHHTLIILVLLLTFFWITPASIADRTFSISWLIKQLVGLIPYFILGHIFSKIKLSKTELFIALSCLISGLLWTAHLYQKTIFAQESFVKYYYDYFSPNIYLLSIGLFASLHWLANYINDIFSRKTIIFLAKLSNLSLGIYLSHILVLNILNTYFNTDMYLLSNFVGGYLTGTLLFIITSTIIYLLSLQRILNRLIT